jgi:uncharacterized protein DUF4328
MSPDLNPYAVPRGAEHAPSRGISPSVRKETPPAEPFRSARVRAWLAQGFAGLYILAGVLLAVSTLNQIELLEAAENAARQPVADNWQRRVIRQEFPTRRVVTEQELFDNDQRQRVLSIVHLATGGGSFLFLLLWYYRAYRNLPALGTAQPKFSPGWAVGYWFVPVLNLVRPCEALLELANGSDPGRTADGRQKGYRPRWNLLILIWWVGNIVGGGVGVYLVISHLPGPRPTAAELIALSQVMVGVTLSGCGLSFLQILVVHRIDWDQEASSYTIQSTAEPSLSFLRTLT